MSAGDDQGADTSLQVHETHIGGVVLVGDHAWKFKKPVDLGFADFSSPAARLQACERETALNRRFAPDVYLGVATLDLPGLVHEPLVAMRRLPDTRRLAGLVARGEDVDDALRGIARTVARAHMRSPRSDAIDECASAAALRARWRDNIANARSRALPDLPAAELDEVEALMEAYIDGREHLFRRRIEHGCAVDGHGDLIAEDIFCLPDGPRLLDCLEFDDRLRFVDRIDDVCFLAMDLERIGAPEAARRLTDLYREFTDDTAPSSLIDHYIAYRAMVRAKVAAIRVDQGEPAARTQARRLLSLTRAHLAAAEITVTLVGGTPATGKTTLARAIADRHGHVLLSSDRIRKEILGLDPGAPTPARFGNGIYSAGHTRATYEELLRRADELVRLGESVVLDATWSDASLRGAAECVALATRSRLVEIRCHAPTDVVRARLGRRPLETVDGPRSDADAQIAESIAAGFAPWPEALTVDTCVEPEACLLRASAAVRPRPVPSVPHRRSAMPPD